MRKLPFILMALMLIVIMGCKKEDDFDNGDNDEIEEIEGFYYGILEDDSWKIYKGNHLIFEVKDRVGAPVLKRHSVYASSFSSDDKLVIWKNGTIYMELPVNSTWVWTNLWVDGNDIIVATSEKNPEDENEYFGKVWRNQHELCSLSMQKYLVLLQPRVVGNNIYAPGYCYCGNDKYKGVIWRNGDVFFSTEGGYCDMIRSVGYYDGCLYYYGSESAPSECFHGKIWKDGEVICDVNEVSWCGYGEINDVIIYNGDVFAAGYIHSPELGEIGVVWKNGEILYQFAERDPMIIYDSRSRVELGSINIIDGDVYVSGRIGNKVPKIWKNGIEYQGIAEGIYGPGKSVYLLKNGMVYQDQF